MRIIKEHIQAQRKTNKMIMVRSKDNICDRVIDFNGITVLMLFLALTVTISLQNLHANASQDSDSSLTALAQQAIVDKSEEVMAISMDIMDMPLHEALETLTEEIGVGLSYSSDIALDKKVTLRMSDVPFHEVLYALLEGTNLEPVLPPTKDVIVIREKEEMIETDLLQETVSGHVTDAQTGEALPGVNVIVEGTTTGTTTDVDGQFELGVPDLQQTLTFSFVGFVTQQIDIDGRNEINVSLNVAAIEGEELVVVGYGSIARQDLTGSISSIQSEAIEDVNATRPDQALLGRLSGVQVKTVSGSPNAAPQIRIRGIGSIAAGVDPLYVVDGFATDNIATLNPADIESMDILKDASATAIYGSRGANGVVIITTKRGTEGITEYSLNTSFGLQRVSALPSTMNAMELAEYAYLAQRNANLDAGNDVSGPPDTWQLPLPDPYIATLAGENPHDNRMVDEILRTSPIHQHQLTASGGSENLRFALSGEFMNNEGIIVGSDYQRYSIRANFDVNLSERLDVQINLNPTFTNANTVDESGSGSYGGFRSASPVNRAGLWPAIFPAYDENGDYFMYSHTDAAQSWNAAAQVREIDDNTKTTRFVGNVNSIYRISEDLEARVLVGSNVTSSKTSRFVPQLDAFQDGGLNIATGNDNATMRFDWLIENILQYDRTFDEHSISGIAGFTAQEERFESNSIFSNTYPNNLVPTLNAASSITSGSSNVNEWSMVSYLARLNYNYDDRYYLTTSIRRDGSSRFGEDNKYGTFSSAAVAWRISNEDFLNVDAITDLKLRASYGQTGSNNIGNYQHIADISFTSYPLGGALRPGFGPGRLANPSLTWETQNQTTVGFDLTLFDNRFFVKVDHFQSRNRDLLLDVRIPAVTGFTNTLTNIGEVKNWGWEFEVSTVNVNSQEFRWNTDFNLSTFRNEVVELGPEGDPIFSAGGMVSGSHVTMIGQPIGMFYGLLTDGIFMNQEEINNGPIFGAGTSAESRPGDIRYVDVNGDGIIDSDDRTVMGSPYPDFYYGMTNRFSYRNVDLSISLHGSYGNEILNMSGIGQLNMRGARVQQLSKNLNYWISEDMPGDGETPRPNDAAKGGNREMSQRYLDSGSFLRINNIMLSYTLPVSFSQDLLGLNSLRVYVNATNPFTFTSNEYTYNVDVSNSNHPLTPGVNFDDYPLPKSLIMGMNIGF